MKSLDKKKTKELDWEKEFDKNWINPWSRNNFGIPKAHLDIKDFISRILTQQRTELLKLVNKAFEETVIESEGHEYGFYEKLNNLLK